MASDSNRNLHVMRGACKQALSASCRVSELSDAFRCISDFPGRLECECSTTCMGSINPNLAPIN